MSLSGAGTTISAVHVVLAMFSFPESASAEVLRRCGVEWRALRSLTRRLGSPRWNDW
jgi:hypothetical protein